MVVKVIITGLPRSGTTITYELIARNNRNKALYLYEPFTPILHDLLSRCGFNAKLHDQLEVTHDYDKVSNEIIESAREIAKNLLKNPKTIENNVSSFIKHLHNDSQNYVIKDLYIWMFIDKILSEINNVRIIFTLRNFNNLYNAFLKWYINDISIQKRIHRSIERVKKMSIKTMIKRIHKIPNVLKLWFMQPSTEWFYGLAPYCKYFNFEVPNTVDKESLYKVLHDMYNIYINIVNKVSNRDNVYVLRLEELQKNPQNITNNLSNFIKEFAIRDYSFIKPIE